MQVPACFHTDTDTGYWYLVSVSYRVSVKLTSMSPNPNTEDLSSYQTDSGGPHGPPWEQIRFGSRSILHSETSLCDVDPPKGGTWLKKLA